jgi:hypothetical protein
MAPARLSPPDGAGFPGVHALLRLLVAGLMFLAGCGMELSEAEPPEADGAPVIAEPDPAAPEPSPAPEPGDGVAAVAPRPMERPAAEVPAPCAATGGTMLLPAQCDAVAGIRAAKGSFNAPSEMVRSETVRIRFALSRTADAAATESAVARLRGATVTIDTRASASMRATLTGQNFEIEALSPERQDLSAAPLATWEWDVQPRQAGEQILTLRTFAEIPSGEGFLVADEKVEDRPIRVVVTTGGAVEDWLDESERWIRRGNNWIVALTALLAAIAGLVAAIRALGRRGSAGTD